MPVNTTKPAANLRFSDRPLQHLQATRYAALKEKLDYSQRNTYLWR